MLKLWVRKYLQFFTLKIFVYLNLWICSYLSNRRQKVTFKSFASTIKSILAGVPQGSVLGPLLFLICINGIAKQVLSLTKLFADDSS